MLSLEVVSCLQKLKLQEVSSCQTLKPEVVSRRWTPEPEVSSSLQRLKLKVIPSLRTRAARVSLPLDARAGNGFLPSETYAASVFPQAEVSQPKCSLNQAPRPRRHNASSSPFANDSQKTVGAHIFRLESFGTGKAASRLSQARTRPAAADARPPASQSPHHQDGPRPR